MANVVCDPIKPVKSSAQNTLDSNLNRPTGASTTFTMVSKTGDLVVPENVHIRFYNCVFDSFDATKGNNVFYFEQCTFNQTPVMTDVVAIASGTRFLQGATITRSKVELIPHEAPNTDPTTSGESPTTKVYCEVNNTFTCDDHSVLKSSQTIFEWLTEGFEDIADDLIRSMGILREVAEICRETTNVVRGIVAWASKSILNLLNFSKYECFLDKFLNIPFTILNMINGCVAKLVNIAFGVLDAALAPILSCAAAITGTILSTLAAIDNVIKAVKSIPSRIASLANGCYLRIIGTAQLVADKVAFLLDTKSRVELMLNSRIMSVNGGIADLANSSKLVLRNCGIVTSPTPGNLIPLIKVDSNSLFDMSRIKFLSTANAPLFSVSDQGKIKLNTIWKIESSAPPDTASLVQATGGTVEVSGVTSIVSNNTIFQGKDSSFIVSGLEAIDLNSERAYIADLDNSYFAG